MKYYCLLLIFLAQYTFSQAPAIQWQQSFGGSDSEEPLSIQKTTDGGYIMAGLTYSNDGNVVSNHSNTGSADGWIVKTASTGAFEWQKTIGGSNDDVISSILQTADGGYLVACYVNSTDGDVAVSYGGTDCWIVKLSATGTIQWQKTLGGTGNDVPMDMKAIPNGYIITGSTQSNNGDVSGNHGGDDAWVVKLSDTGVIQWQKTLGGTANDFGYGITPTTDGGYIMGGDTRSSDGDLTTNQGTIDCWLVKLNSTGTIEWQKSFGGSSYDSITDVLATPDGGCVVAAYTASANGDVTNNQGGSDYWILKFSATGLIEWQKTFGGSGDELAFSIAPSSAGGYVVTGYTLSSDGDVTANHGGADLWMIGVSPSGQLLWNKALGGTSDEISGFTMPTSDGFALIGASASSDGDVSANHGIFDFWLVKLGADGLATTDFTTPQITVTPNPTTKILTLQDTANTVFDNISIIDTIGKVVLSQNQCANQINVEALAKGMYILQASSETAKYTTKFIKE